MDKMTCAGVICAGFFGWEKEKRRDLNECGKQKIYLTAYKLIFSNFFQFIVGKCKLFFYNRYIRLSLKDQ